MNKNLSQLGQQLAAIWKQLGLNQRISIVMATGVVIARTGRPGLLVQPGGLLAALRQAG